MTKKADLVERITSQSGFTRAESTDLIESVFKIIKDTLASGEMLKVTGFGNFVVKEKNNRCGRNPHTGETITIETRRVLTFKPSMVLRNAINGAGGAE